MVNKELEIGIVYNPLLEQLFTARRGRGAFLNGKPIRSSNVDGEFCINSFKCITKMYELSILRKFYKFISFFLRTLKIRDFFVKICVSFN